jgi:hypothetical protein
MFLITLLVYLLLLITPLVCLNFLGSMIS